jgi:putative ABC transport system substrate-binding protein
MRRRDFITLLGSAAAAWPVAARAQQAALPVIGYLHDSSPESISSNIASFREGLGQMGYVEGRNVAIEFRFAYNKPELLPGLAAELVRRQVAVIATLISTPASLAAKGASTTIPIVFGIGGDPVQAGLVASINRPGGNITGISTMGREIGGKHVGLLRELLPQAKRFAVLVNPSNPFIQESYVAEVRAAAASIGLQIEIFNARSSSEIDAAYAKLVESRVEAVLISPDGLFIARRVQIVSLEVRHGLPAIYVTREEVAAGGLMAYGTSTTEQCRVAGTYVARILKGEKPSALPVMLPTKFDFIINLQAAKHSASKSRRHCSLSPTT